MALAADGRYTIQRGDTLEKIGRYFGVSEAQLVATNAIRNRHRIQAGQSMTHLDHQDLQVYLVDVVVQFDSLCFDLTINF